MGSGDGEVLTTTKIVDHGPDSDRFNIVVLGDGYRSADLETSGKFIEDVQLFIGRLQSTLPFEELWDAINVYRINVSSNDAGADDPVCTDTSPPTPTGVTPRTYFDASFCSDSLNGPMRRLLTVDSERVTTEVSSRVPLRDVIIVLVNTPIPGGSGASVVVSSTEDRFEDTVIHEIGHHPIFGLWDEYESGGTLSLDAVEPATSNLTLNAQLTNTEKWGDLILAGTPKPTKQNCPVEVRQPSWLPYGTYEGGGILRCGVYRPWFYCKMRDSGWPFCQVCSRVIRQVLEPYLPS